MQPLRVLYGQTRVNDIISTTSEGEIAMEALSSLVILFHPLIFQKPEQDFDASMKFTV